MEELSIKIKIADREFPMRVRANEEEILRSAGKLVNNKIKQLGEDFHIDDKQSLLSMVAFDLMVKNIKLQRKLDSVESDEQCLLEEFFTILSSLDE